MIICVYEVVQGCDGVGSESIIIMFICIGMDDELQVWDVICEHMFMVNVDFIIYDGFNLQSLQVEECIVFNVFRLQAIYVFELGKLKGQEMLEINGGEWSFLFDGGGIIVICMRFLVMVGVYGHKVFCFFVFVTI